MGRARRFNPYDTEVLNIRRQSELAGRTRQVITGISSSFRSPPKVSPIPKTNTSGGGTGGSSDEPYATTLQTPSSSSGTLTIDLNYHTHTVTVDESITTISFSNIPASGQSREFSIRFDHDGVGGTFTITWPSSAGGDSFTLSSGESARYVLHTEDGGTSYEIQTLIGATFSGGADIQLSNLGTTALNADINLNGQKLAIDTDKDTYLVENADDVVDFYIGGSLKVQSSSGSMSYQSGFPITMGDLIEFSGMTAPGSANRNIIYAENLTNDELVLNSGTSGAIRFDINGTEFASFASGETQIGSASGYNFNFLRDDATPTDDDQIVKIFFQGNNSSATVKNFVTIEALQRDVTASTEDGAIKLSVISKGTADATFLHLNSATAETLLTYQANQDAANIDIVRDESTPATGRVGRIDWITEDSASNATQFFTIDVDATTITNGAEDSTITFKGYDAGTQRDWLVYTGNVGITILETTTEQLGFYGSAGSNKQTVSGSRGGNAALQGLLTALANLGLITDSTT